MNVFNPKKRELLTFDQFLKVKVGVEKGSADIVDDGMAGEKKGDAATATMDDPKKVNIPDGKKGEALKDADIKTMDDPKAIPMKK